MKNPVSAWAATAPSEIGDSKPLTQKQLSSYSLTFHKTPTALWVVVQYPNGARIGFRCVYALGSVIETCRVARQDELSVVFRLTCKLGSYDVQFAIQQSDAAVFRYTTRFTPKEDIFVPFSPRDIVPLPEGGQVSEVNGIVHAQQIGTRSGQLFFSLENPDASVFYFQNLTALSPYCDMTQTSAGDTVGGSFPEIGFSLPTATQKPLLAGQEVVVSDAFVLLSQSAPKDDAAIAVDFLNYLSQIYLLLPKPETEYHDWPQIAQKGLRDLRLNKGCWTQSGGKPYLNAYVCDYDTPPEIMVQLAVLVPLTEYFEWLGEDHEILDEIRNGLPVFYDEKLKCLNRWLPHLQYRLDQSEEQKKEYVMDSWYLHHPLMNLSRLALRGDKISEKLLLDSIDFAIKVAHRFRYKWPVFYKMDTLEVLKKEVAKGKGGEKDVPGAYAHLMLQMYDLTHDKKYLDEAIEAAKYLEDVGFEIFYQANNTAFSAATMLRLYKITGKKKYLDLSYVCVACIFKNMQIWESNYGFTKFYPRFFGVYPLSDAPYTAPYEELEVYAALYYYIGEADGVDLLPSVKLLIAEFMRYFVFRMKYYYPEFLPKEMLADEVKTGEIDLNLWIPLEDLRDGWEQSGQVGQEVYGAAGAGFGIVPRQYYRIGNSGAMMFCDYPVLKFRNYKDKSVTFELSGDERLLCRIMILGTGVSKSKFVLSERKKDDKQLEAVSSKRGWLEYEVFGSSKLKITYG